MKIISVIYKMFVIAIVCNALFRELFRDGQFIKEAMYYFTIQSNFFVVGSLVLFLFLPDQWKGRSFIRGTVLLAITLTGIVYTFVLHNIFLDWGTAAYAFPRTATHIIAPLGYFFDWIFFDQHHQMRYRDIFLWMSYPLFYCLFSIYAGMKSGTFLYFFFNPAKGYLVMGKWLAILFFILLGAGTVYVSISKGINHRKLHLVHKNMTRLE